MSTKTFQLGTFADFPPGKWYDAIKGGADMNRIKELREKANMKQSELGRLLNVQAAAVSKYESEKVPLTAETIIAIANIFHVSVDYVLCRDFPYGGDHSIGGILGYEGTDEAAVTFQNKLANQIDFSGAKIEDLATYLGVPEKTILDWLTDKDTSYVDYYHALSEFFQVSERYWTSPHAISPGIEPNMDEYMLLLMRRDYMESGKLNETYGTLDHFFPGVSATSDPEEKELLSIFRRLNRDSKDILKGKAKETLRLQRYDEGETEMSLPKVAAAK